MQRDAEKLNDAEIIRGFDTIKDRLIRRLWILKVHIGTEESRYDRPRSLKDKTLIRILEARREDSISRHLKTLEGISSQVIGRNSAFIRRYHPPITKATARRYRYRLMHAGRSGSIRDFRRILSERFRFKVSTATLKRWFAGKCPPSSKHEDLHRVFRHARKRWSIDTAAELERLEKEFEKAKTVGSSSFENKKTQPTPLSNARGRHHELRGAPTDPLAHQLFILKGEMTIEQFHARVTEWAGHEFSRDALHAWVSGERPPGHRVRGILSRMIRWVRLRNLSSARRIRGRTAH